MTKESRSEGTELKQTNQQNPLMLPQRSHDVWALLWSTSASEFFYGIIFEQIKNTKVQAILFLISVHVFACTYMIYISLSIH